MFHRDQQDFTASETARIMARYAPDYEDYLFAETGRKFLLALPVATVAPMRLVAKFAAEQAASGEKSGPSILLRVEFNQAMGLYTVQGEFYAEDGDAEPIFRSTPRNGFDDELLGQPARLFDWLAHAAKGEPVSFAADALAAEFEGLETPAGAVEDILAEADEDTGMFVLRLAPEYRMPLDYYVSGTDFPGPKGGEHPLARHLTQRDWENSYATPVRDAVQKAADDLYGAGVYGVDVDLEGYVYVTGLLPVPAQNFGSLSPPPGASTMSYPKDSNLRRESRGTWYTDELLRMAGVRGERLDDRRLSEEGAYTGKSQNKVQTGGYVIGSGSKKKAPPATFQLRIKDSANQAAHNGLVAQLRKRKKAGEKIDDPEKLANWIMLQKAGRMSHGGRKAAKEESMTPDLNAALEGIISRLNEKSETCAQCECALGDESIEGPEGERLCEKCAGKTEAKSKFASLVKKLKKNPEVENPEALAAWIGRKKLGDAEFEKRQRKARTRKRSSK